MTSHLTKSCKIAKLLFSELSCKRSLFEKFLALDAIGHAPVWLTFTTLEIRRTSASSKDFSRLRKGY